MSEERSIVIWFHRLRSWWKHLLGTNTGNVESWYDYRKLMVGFRCNECGSPHSVHESVTNDRDFSLPENPGSPENCPWSGSR